MSSNNLDKTFIIKSIEIPSECKIVKTPSIYDCNEDEKINFNDGINFLDKIVSYNNEDIIGKILVGSEEGFILEDKDSSNNFFVTGGTINYLDNLGILTLSRNDDEDVVIQGLLNNFITGGRLDNNKLFFNNNNNIEFDIDLTEIIFTGITNISEIENRSYNDLQDLPVIPTDLNQLTDNNDLLFSGNYNDLSNLPILFDGDYNSLTNLPTLFDGQYSSLSGTPVNLSDFTNDLGFITGITNITEISLRDYNNLQNLPNLNQATFTIDLIEELTIDLYTPYNLRISSVTNIVNAPVTVIQVNDNSYTFNDLINQGDKISISVDINSVINLNVLYE